MIEWRPNCLISSHLLWCNICTNTRHSNRRPNQKYKIQSYLKLKVNQAQKIKSKWCNREVSIQYILNTLLLTILLIQWVWIPTVMEGMVKCIKKMTISKKLKAQKIQKIWKKTKLKTNAEKNKKESNLRELSHRQRKIAKNKKQLKRQKKRRGLERRMLKCSRKQILNESKFHNIFLINQVISSIKLIFDSSHCIVYYSKSKFNILGIRLDFNSFKYRCIIFATSWQVAHHFFNFTSCVSVVVNLQIHYCYYMTAKFSYWSICNS